jgi:hypothetical protein
MMKLTYVQARAEAECGKKVFDESECLWKDNGCAFDCLNALAKEGGMIGARPVKPLAVVLDESGGQRML